MSWYSTGNVSVTNGSTTVTGSETNFSVGAQIGEGFLAPDDKLYEIATITSATVIVLADNYLGSTQTGQTYKIVPTQSLVADLAAEVTDLISDYATVKDNAGAGKHLDGTAANPAIKFIQDQDTGFYRVGANEIGVAVGGLNVASFGSTGLTTLGNNLLDSSDIDATVQAYDADTAKLDVAQTFTANQTMAAGFDLDAIAATKAVTAVDVFIYDTSKDSDGGAWRKRTQGTSWYNETLNTSTRGSRKEFPAVAVIVAESNKVTIYDGDDPSMPMWMVFTGNGALLYQTAESVSIINGIASIATNTYGLVVYNFIGDFIGRYRASVAQSGKKLPLSAISDRASSHAGNSAEFGGIINDTVNDIAMTVLPNAPIDSATGLPIPTIAVATNGGTSIIKDDGSVVDITGQVSDIAFVYFDNGRVVCSGDYQSEIHVFTIPSADIVSSARDYRIVPTASSGDVGIPKSLGNASPTQTGLDNVFSSSEGLTVVDEDTAAFAKSSVAYITSDYNTGYMTGDIKGAWLSSTDDDNLVGSELVTNGTFDTDTAGWTILGAGTGISDTGRLKLTASTDAYQGAEQTFTVEIGKTYTVSIEKAVTTNNSLIRVGNLSSNYVSTGNVQAIGIYNYTVVATTTTMKIKVYAYTNGSVVHFDNISVRLADQDRSVNNNGLQVFGNISKTPVATGADLVAYSGFSASNYLEQPYNSDLDFGTGDFSVMGWFKPSSDLGNYPSIIGRISINNTESTAWTLRVNKPTLKYYFFSGNAVVLTSTTPVVYDTWQFLVAVRRSGVLYLYCNGLLDTSGAMTNSISNSSARTTIGQDATYGTASSGLALFRISATAPSAQQIKDIYEAEKPLFQAGAQATLEGTSDAVTALAFDDSTQELLVGTSQHTSIFRGLQRVETIAGSASAISASNGLRVIED